MAKKITDSVSKKDKIKKSFVQYIKFQKGYSKALMILGCQRSGTTLISHLFNQLDYSRVFGEFSILSNKGVDRIRLNSSEEVISIFEKSHSPLIVFKPLVESQNAKRLLDTIPKSNVLWVYRNYRDVAASDVKKFAKTAGHGNILPIINNDHSNWRSENVSEETRSIIKSMYSEQLSPQDCACLFWYARNILFYEQALESNDQVYIWPYEDFIGSPQTMFNQLIASLALPKPKNEIFQDIYNDSVNSSSDLVINKDINDLCANLLERLNNTSLKKNGSLQ
jgi:hypothetical protein